MTTLDRVPTQIAPPPEAHAAAVASIRSGAPFTLVLSDDPAERAALLQAVTDTVADLETRFIYVGNPLRAPLTVERLFMQTVGPEADVRLERDPATLARVLATPVGDEARLVIVIAQPESLDSEALQALQAMAPFFAAVVPRVQIVFCGRPAFESTMDQTKTPDQPAPEPPRAAPPPAPAPAPAPALLLPARRRRVWPLVFLAVVLALAAGGAFVWRTRPELLLRFGLVAPHPAPAVPTAPQAASDGAPALANPAEEQGMLRRDFEEFLATRPDAAGLSGEEKDRLFNEFVQRRRERTQ